MVLSQGEHLVKIVMVQNGLSELRKTPYLLIRFKNRVGYIDDRLYKNQNSIKFTAKLFQAVHLNFDSDFDWLSQCEKLIDKYLIITIIEAKRVKEGKEISYFRVFKYHSVQKLYKYYSEEPQEYPDDYDNSLFQFQKYDGDGDFISIPTVRKYFIEFESGHKYMIERYNDFNKDTEPRLGGIINLFLIDPSKKPKDCIVMSVQAPAIYYYNEKKGMVGQLKQFIVETFFYDHMGYETDREFTFHTLESANNFVEAFNNEPNALGSVAEIIFDGKQSSKGHNDRSEANDYIRAKIDEKYVDNMLGNLNKADQDLLDSAFDGDPENSRNID
jgi:hypothetical protein